MLKYYFAETFKAIKNSRLSTFLTIITISLAITLAVVSFVLLFFSNQIDKELKDRIEINLFLNDTLDQNEINEIKKNLIADKNIRSAKYLSKSDALTKFVNETGEDFTTVLEANPLPSSFIIKFKSELISTGKLDQAIREYKIIKGIDDVVYDYSFTFQILKFLTTFQHIIYVISIIIFIIAVYLSFSTTNMLIGNRITQFNTMKLVGAKLSSIRIPIYLYGIFLGLIASILSFVVYSVFYYLLTNITNYSKFNIFFYTITVIIISLGILFGLIGSYFAALRVTLKIERSYR